MFLVHEKKDRGGKWEIAWMWLPHFLASDPSLHKQVAQRMTEKFKGAIIEDEKARQMTLKQMHEEVLHSILEKYPILGLRQYLEAIIHLEPEQKS